MQADDVRPCHQPVNVGFKGDSQFILDTCGKAVPLVVDDVKAKGLGAHGYSFANPTKTDDPKRLAADAVAKHARWAPAAPFAAADDALPLAKAARHIQDQRHCQIRSIVGEYTGSVRDHDAFGLRRSQIDMVDAGAIAGNQLKLRWRGRYNICVDAIRHSWHKHVAIGHCCYERVARQWCVVHIETCVKQFGHPFFNSRE